MQPFNKDDSLILYLDYLGFCNCSEREREKQMKSKRERERERKKEFLIDR
jgi:hypothetical protein